MFELWWMSRSKRHSCTHIAFVSQLRCVADAHKFATRYGRHGTYVVTDASGKEHKKFKVVRSHRPLVISPPVMRLFVGR